MNAIKCPYCKETFDEDYYYDWHIPCPEDSPSNEEKAKALREGKTSLSDPENAFFEVVD
jgi:hypothetical protein